MQYSFSTANKRRSIVVVGLYDFLGKILLVGFVGFLREGVFRRLARFEA